MSRKPRYTCPANVDGVRRVSIAILAALTLAAACSSGRSVTRMESGGEIELPTATTSPSAQAAIAAWPAMRKEAATKLIDKYGPPDVVGERMLVWHDKGPYVKTSISRDEVAHNFPMPHTDFLAQTVKYRVPLDKLDDLAAYDGSVWFHRTRGEMTAQCDMEELNNLALNLAHDVASGRRTIDDARAFYGKTAMAFKSGDRSSPYLTGLIFQPSATAADPDTALTK